MYDSKKRRARYLAKRGEVLASRHEYYERNKEEEKEKAKKYYALNKEKLRKNHREYMWKKRKSISKGQVGAKLKKQPGNRVNKIQKA